MPTSTAETLLVNKIFSVALEKKATDIHLVSGNYPIFRIDGTLHVMKDEKILNVETLNALVDMLLKEEDKEYLTIEREVRTVYTWANRARFRASIFYQQGFPALSFRLIPSEIPDPKKLHIPDTIVERSQRRHGLIVICGPFNSGRTTTMVSLLQHINLTASKRIVTLEQPVEYLLVNSKSMINQREVGRDTPTFIHGVKDAIDEDVDVIGVGALHETGVHERIITLVESGKLVIAVANAISTISALEKFITSIPEQKRQWAKDAMSTLLLAVMNQRLVPAIGGGHLLASGILTMTPAVTAVLQDEHFTQLTTVMQTSREEGMVTLDVRLQELVREGKVPVDAARRYANDPSIIH